MATPQSTPAPVEHVPVVFSVLKSFQGGCITKPIALPLYRIRGVEMIRVSEREKFFTQMMCGAKLGLHASAVRSVLKTILEKYEEAVCDTPPSQQPLVCCGEDAHRRLFEESGDEHDSEACPEVYEDLQAGKRKGGRPLATLTWDEVSFRAIKMYGIMHIEISPEICEKLLAEGRRALQRPGDRAEKRKDALTQGDDECIVGEQQRVTWLSPLSSWQITYINASGVRSTSRTGLSVPRTNKDGHVLTVDEKERMRASVMDAAKRMWDQKDCSGAERFYERDMSIHEVVLDHG